MTYAFANFGPLIVFYATNHFWGLKPAIAMAVIWTIGEIVYKRTRREKTTMFFKFSATIAIVFGLIDLTLKDSFLFKYEASMTNVIVGLFFGATIFGEKSIIQEFFERKKNLTEPMKPKQVLFFRWLTVLWVAYFIAKAAFYGWVSWKYSIERALVIRGIVGNTSLALLILGSFALGPQIYRLADKLGLLRSA
ncbi:MAG: septation protein IspZ [Pseudomonadota bacterium]